MAGKLVKNVTWKWWECCFAGICSCFPFIFDNLTHDNIVQICWVLCNYPSFILFSSRIWHIWFMRSTWSSVFQSLINTSILSKRIYLLLWYCIIITKSWIFYFNIKSTILYIWALVFACYTSLFHSLKTAFHWLKGLHYGLWQ